MAYTLDTTVGDLLADARVKPTLDQYFPGLADNPQVALFKGVSLRAVASNPLAASFGLTQAQVEAFLAEVNQRIG